MNIKENFKKLYEKQLENPLNEIEKKWYVVGFFTAFIISSIFFFPIAFYSNFLKDIGFKNFNVITSLIYISPMIFYALLIYTLREKLFIFSTNIAILMFKKAEEKQEKK
jgi:hypothetical protein